MLPRRVFKGFGVSDHLDDVQHRANHSSLLFIDSKLPEGRRGIYLALPTRYVAHLYQPLFINL